MIEQKNKVTDADIVKQTRQHRADVLNITRHKISDLVERSLFHDEDKLEPKNLKVLVGMLNGEIPKEEWSEIHLQSKDHHIEYYRRSKPGH